MHLSNDTMNQAHLSFRLLGATVMVAALAVVACDPDAMEPRDQELLEADLDEEDMDDDEPVSEHPDFELTAAPDVQAYVWKGWVSEEQPASTCGTGQIVTGADCALSHCDSTRLQCHGFGGAYGESYWSNWFSEEAPNNFHQCPNSYYISGVTCSGSDCDNLSVECTNTSLAKNNCSWTGAYSEEQPPYVAPAGKAIAGIWCSGSHCDNHYYWVCSV